MTFTHTPSPVPTNTLVVTLTPRPTFAPRATVVPGALQAMVDDARDFEGHNRNWEPFVYTFGGVEMMLVPAECFYMGNTDYGPVHRVCFDEPFWIDKTEVTNAQFATFQGKAAEGAYYPGDMRPRTRITWDEAQAFCESRGARLPTEAEWEFAARGPDAWRYPWGDDFDPDYVVYGGNASDASAVGSLLAGASWVGALDMSGNVWEWVADWHSGEYYATLPNGVVNPTGPISGAKRVLRGGSYADEDYFKTRAAFREDYFPLYTERTVGFRCASSS